jgi:hypothetical protein
VLVPSPPAATEPPWFADDPVAVGDGAGDRPGVSPVPNGDITWDELARDEEDLRPWCAARWLGGWDRLPDPPADVERSRRGLHTLAEWVISPARAAANGKIGLRWTYGGLGTPFFTVDGRDRQVRLDGMELVIDEVDSEHRVDLTTMSAAADAAGADLTAGKPYKPMTTPDETTLGLIEPAGVAFFNDWFGFSTSVLEQLRCEATPEEDASRVQLWPEHFDAAFEQGAGAARAGYGCSPGDDEHPLPYAYVTPWGTGADDPFWCEPHFRGARMDWVAITAAVEQREAVLEFFRQGRDLLRG